MVFPFKTMHMYLHVKTYFTEIESYNSSFVDKVSGNNLYTISIILPARQPYIPPVDYVLFSMPY